MVAKELNRHYIGCELHEDYGELIQQRVPGEEVSQDQLNPLQDLLY